jgi:23S rRNA G2445 N2-methylase RlmL
MRRIKQTYLAQTQPGFDQIAVQEIETQLERVTIRGVRTVADKNSIVLFDYAGDVQELLALRTVEDVFALVATLPDPPPTYAGLHALRDMATQMKVERAVSLARSISPSRGGQGKPRYRVVSRQVGRTAYRRVDAQQAVEKGINARTDRRWQLVDEGALEFWLTLLPDEALLALRLSDERMRHRDNKREHLPASLRPTAAAALVWLTQPEDEDVFLDPMCGAGTILIERAQVGRYAQLIGGDIDPEAIAVTRGNIGPRYKPIDIHEWDARDLPLDAASISACAVNLPFGKQIGDPEENRKLYPAFLREMARVLRPGARLVVLTGDAPTFDRAAQRATRFTRRETYGVLVLGQRARVYVLERG